MKKNTHRRAEQGNVLFLILIAVALFAALSYAVTSSTRGGGSGAGEETNLVQSSAITQYPSAVRTSLIRMIVNGTSTSELLFDTPSNSFDDEINTDILKEQSVFHPNGGGASKGTAPSDIMADGDQGTWVFSSEYQIEGIGTDGSSGNDIIAFLPGIKQSICQKVNDELGVTDGTSTTMVTVPTSSLDQALDVDGSGTDNSGMGTYDATNRVIGDAFASQPFGCITVGTSYVYYHALVEL